MATAHVLRKAISVLIFSGLLGALMVGKATAGTIGTTTITPKAVVVGTATTVTVTSLITDPSVIPSSVVLQSLDSSGRVIAILGNLHDDGLNGDAVAGDGIYTIQTPVYQTTPGSITLRVSAGFKGSLLRSFSSSQVVNITGTSIGISILSPANLLYTNFSPVTVRGTVGDPGAQVTVNGINAPVSAGQFVATVPLVEGLNTLTAVATNTNAMVTTASVQVTLDTTPPHLTIDSPADGVTTTATSITVTGTANDVVVGTVNSGDVQVTVNGIAAQVANRTYAAPNVPLSLGKNTLQAKGIDRAGNAATTSITVTRVLPSQPPQPTIGQALITQSLSIVSGNNQTGTIGTQLKAPLVVALRDTANNPVPNQTVVFKVTGNNGTVSTGGAGTPASAVAVTTGANGQAQVFWTLGQRAGAGINIVRASSALAVGAVDFTATGLTATPAAIVVDSGNNQTGALGQPLAFPFVATVIDAGHNRVPNVPVTFTVKQGGGNLAGGPSLAINTDSNGRAIAVLTLGTQPGNDNNLVEASFSGNSGLPAAFTASARTPGDLANTTISGVVLDNSNNPIEGVTMRLFQTNQGSSNNLPVQVGALVQTNAQGTFLMQHVPVGFFKLMADGSTAGGPQRYPTLEYDIVTVAGNDNTVGMPIYLPALDTSNQLCVDATHGGTLTLPQVPGFSLTVLPGSATFPGGSRQGCITVTPVHGDKVPMTPGFGQQPRFIVTIQPVGTTFNPPAPMTLPNVDGLPPKAVTEMYSYDHDLGMFVAIGTGTVSDDGSVIASNPGVGVLKAGWHGGGNPNPTGSAGTCPECQMCQGASCVADPAQQSRLCNNNRGCCNNGICELLSVNILSADITQNQIIAQLGPQCASGRLTLELIGASTHAIRTVDHNAGTFTETFDIPNIPSRSEFTNIRATWTVNNAAVSTNFPYHIKIHGAADGGDVRHSVYNTPYEAQCPETTTSDVYITTVVGNTCQYRASTLNSTFKQQLDTNGSGVSINNGTLQVEALAVCLNNAPAGSRGRLYRAVNAIRPACGGGVNEGTVASYEASRNHNPLNCGARLFIYDLGNGLGTTKTVTDNCPACGPSPTYARQLDNYTTRQACNPHAFVDYGIFKTIEIFGR